MKLPHYSTVRRPVKSLALIALFTALPPALLAVALIRYPFDAPWMDQWAFIPTLEKWYSGTLTLADLWAQHNEHRIPVARALLLMLAWVTHWNVLYETAATYLVALATFLLVLRQLANRAPGLAIAPWPLLIPVLSLLFFNLSQWQNWFVGWQLEVFLYLAAAIAGLGLVTRAFAPEHLTPPPSFQRRVSARAALQFCAALFAGLIAMLSFATGLVYWPAGAVALELSPPATRRARWTYRLLWYAAWALSLAAYLHGYVKPPSHPGIEAVFAMPGRYTAYVLAYLGSPLVAHNVPAAAIAGAIGIALLATLPLLLVRRGLSLRPQALYIAMGVHALLGAALTGIGRLDFGVDQALSSRYITPAMLLWLAVLVLAAAAWPHIPLRPRLRHATAIAATAIIILMLAYNARFGLLQWTERRAFRLPARAELVSNGDNLDLLQRLHPDPRLVIERREVLKRYGLSVFHDPR